MEPGDEGVTAGDVETIAREIMAYLHLNPSAADTLEGIARWWLQSGEPNLATVQRALDDLQTSHQVMAVKRTGDEICYTLNPK